LQPYELVSALLSTAGAALLYTLELDSSKARDIGPQILLGIGIGLGNQVPMTTLQSFSKPEAVAPTTGIMLSKFPVNSLKYTLLSFLTDAQCAMPSVAHT
jgi:hypothetical protein